MSRLLVCLAIGAGIAAVLAAGAAWRRVGELETRAAQQSSRIERLEGEAEEAKLSLELLRKFTLVNHKRIRGLQRKRVVTVTAYSPRVQETDSTPFRTATNNRVRAGIVAVSRDLFESGWVFGKKVYIQNHGVFVIDDLMAADKREQVDIFMHDTSKALAFGKKSLEAYLLDG